jgi:hypothetical protein
MSSRAKVVADQPSGSAETKDTQATMANQLQEPMINPRMPGDDEHERNREEERTVFAKIKWLHFAAALFFLVQTVAYAAVGLDTKTYPSIGVTDCDDGPVCATECKQLGAMSVAFLIPLFTGLACVDHVASFIACVYYANRAKEYIFEIGSNPLRWIEYSISASVMAVTIAILSGVNDVHLWLLIFIAHAICMGLGQLIELIPGRRNRQAKPEAQLQIDNALEDGMQSRYQSIRWLAFLLASVSMLGAWAVIACYFFRAVDGDVPGFVYAAFIVTFVLYLCFAANSLFCNLLGWYRFPTAEIIYISLSFTAKTFLAADVFGGLKAGED